MKGSLYNHPRVVWLLLLLILFAGLNAFNTMPRLEDPHMESRIVQVSTLYPGADAERVEAEITEKLERKLREVPEVKEVTSVSRPNISFITVQLKDMVTDAKPITARLRDKVAEVTDLPEGATDPEFRDTAMYAHSAIIALTWEADSPINYTILGRHAREFENKLRNLSGTDFVDVLGLPKEEIRIEVDDAKLAAHGLTVADVARKIQGSDARGTAGVVSSPKNEMVVQVAGALDSLNRIRMIPLAFDEKGASLRISDIATVTRSFEDPPKRLAYLNGSYGVVIAARMYQDNRIDYWSDNIAAILEEEAATLPASIKMERIFDERDYADERLSGLMGNLEIGAIVVLTVLFVSLGWRASLIAASILPLTLLASLAILDLLGMRIQQVVVTGLIVALGIMVDNAIVITDEIQQRRLKGERRSVAVAKTVRKLWQPLAGSTLTTIIAFMPLILLPGNAGEFMLGVPAAVIASLIASYIIAFTIISAVAGRIVEGKSNDSAEHHRVWWRDGIKGGIIADLFERSLRWSVHKPLRSIAVSMAVPLIGFVLAGQLTEQFFPISDRNQFTVQLKMPAQASIEETRATAEKMQKLIAAKDGVLNNHWFIGSKPAKFYYAMITSNDGVASIAEGLVTVDGFERVTTLVPELQAELTEMAPEAAVIVREFSSGPPLMAPVEVRILGPDLAELERIGDEVRAIIAELPHITNTQTSLKAGRPMVEVAAREEDASVTGLSLSDIETQLQTLTNGLTATYLIEETEQVPVRLIVDKGNREDLNSIANMNLIAPRSGLEQDNSYADIPVAAIADIRLTTKVGTINHFNGERMNKVTAYLEFGVLPQTILDKLQARLAESPITIPSGYKLEFGGESEERDEVVGKLFGTVGILVVMMLLTIVLTFNSFRMAYITFAAAVQAGGLGMLSMWVFDYPLNFVVIIGVMGLIGLAINAAIVILSELRGIPDARAGNEDAVVHGVMKTGRHIISTTLTTVGGFMPLIMAGGLFWPPFAVAIAGGALLSMIVSFYFAPAAFLYLTRMRPVTGPGGDFEAAVIRRPDTCSE